MTTKYAYRKSIFRRELVEISNHLANIINFPITSALESDLSLILVQIKSLINNLIMVEDRVGKAEEVWWEDYEG